MILSFIWNIPSRAVNANGSQLMQIGIFYMLAAYTNTKQYSLNVGRKREAGRFAARMDKGTPPLPGKER